MESFGIEILKQFVSYQSVTPNGKNIISYCQNLLQTFGFKTKIYQHGDVTNFYAKLDRGGKNFCFAGHVDVVPAVGNWTYNPWQLTEYQGKLYGRGTNDMKGPLAAALSAIRDFIKLQSNLSISVALTSDEEIMTQNGMHALVYELEKINEKIDYCVLPESCSPHKSGTYIKVGCKGSLNVDLTYNATQKHVAVVGNHLHNFIEVVNNLIHIKLVIILWIQQN